MGEELKDVTRHKSVRGPGGNGKSMVLSDLMSTVWFSQLTLPLDQCGLKVCRLKMAPLFPSCCLLSPWDFLGLSRR